MNQLTLKIALLDGFDFDSFYPMQQNRDALALLHSAFWQSFQQVFLYGEAGSGKSHLLQACCYKAQEASNSASYFSLKQLAPYGVRVLEGLDRCTLLAIDDLDYVIGNLEWETAVFHLINRCRQNGQPLLFAAHTNPHQINCLLPDLGSRLIWGPAYKIYNLDEISALEAFKWRAYKRGLQIPEHLIKYINKNFPKDIQSLMRVLDQLDKASLHKGRKITRNLIQEIFPDNTLTDSVQ
ncbi:DnaA regulatory inactivator Hda [uncultured Thiothrix sp.]|uniref:DnaA regulatory inactivator Hda n=1 Tax=uncultured Thiothrix sp. TaxID=223185 RepID=UPI0026173D12|nr:DnaA regulatory inactivator Hda [uncultured Thiothrix sp.]